MLRRGRRTQSHQSAAVFAPQNHQRRLPIYCTILSNDLAKDLSKTNINATTYLSATYITPGGIRTPNLWFRRPLLYPVELRARFFCGGTM